MTNPQLIAAYAYCQKVAYDHYENFPTASRLLPAKVRPAIAAVYAFSRLADDFADEPEFASCRLQRLDDWRHKLHAPDDSHEVFVALRDTIATYGLPLSLFDDLLDAFCQDVVQNRHQNFESLLKYSSRSANPVGRLVLLVCGQASAERFIWSDAICTGLQLANFWQDVSIDLDKDRIYIPQDLMSHFHVNESDLVTRHDTTQTRLLMKELVSRTRVLFEDGRPLLETLTGRLGWQIRLTWHGGMAILDRIVANDFAVLNHRPQLSRWDFIKLLWKSL